MLPRLFCNNFRRLKLGALPNGSLKVPNSHNSTLVPPILLQQNIVNFSLSGPVTTKNTKLKTPTNKAPSKSATDGDRVEYNIRDEEMYLQSLNDPDTFQSRDYGYLKESVVPGYTVQSTLIENRKRNPLTEEQYAYRIKKHLNNNRLKEAIDVLEIQMIEQDQVKPKTYIFNLLISGCAHAGSSSKAFNLYTKMQQYGVNVTNATYTSLFNACANGPWPHDGLNKARRLREILLEKNYEPNAPNYNAMIKAFGRCGDVTTAFKLVDEMESKDLDIQVGTYNFLLQACISDVNYGFRHALMVWNKIYQRRLLPDLHSFNLMFRCVRDCSIGDIKTMQQVNLLGSTLDSDEQSKINDNQLLNNDSQSSEIIDEAPGLVSHFPQLGSLAGPHEVKTPEDRLLLLGGFKGILNEMEKLQVRPDVKTFTALLDVVPSTAEHEIIESIRKHNVKCDIGFFNCLIKKRSMRLDYDGAKGVLNVMETAGLRPNIVTYAAMAMGCRNIDELRDFLTEVHKSRMSTPILEVLLKQGCRRRDFPYIIEIMNFISKEELKPNKQFLDTLHRFIDDCYSVLNASNDNPTGTAEFEAAFDNFKLQFTKWKDSLGLNV
ncbi:pentatricopeptide repeat-containing protein 1, mitochondrial-like [Bradysia coprophila]|uniref:pentatricopeptide repeat-containing protein 1, mitochondrial-like n=1 Tax=Bradysia coprophila TaxID=38358 RepID=UPI00187DD553|nr:pentatricopeptide repeat-containing protein 1, mitochondrial-like [Bradysia coprophila]